MKSSKAKVKPYPKDEVPISKNYFCENDHSRNARNFALLPVTKLILVHIHYISTGSFILLIAILIWISNLGKVNITERLTC